MNFLDPKKWKDLEALSKEYEELTDELVKELHTKLKPYFLRRIKSEVLQLPPKVGLPPIAFVLMFIGIRGRTRLLFLSAWHHCRRKSIDRSSV